MRRSKILIILGSTLLFCLVVYSSLISYQNFKECEVITPVKVCQRLNKTPSFTSIATPTRDVKPTSIPVLTPTPSSNWKIYKYDDHWNVYQNKTYGYSMKYPKEWYINTEEAGWYYKAGGMFFDIPNPENPSYPADDSCMVGLGIHDSEGASLDEWIKRGWQYPDRKKISVQGFPAVRISYDSWENPVEATFLRDLKYKPGTKKFVKLHSQLFIAKEGRIYTVSGHMPIAEIIFDNSVPLPEEKIRQCKDVVNLMSESFVFL